MSPRAVVEEEVDVLVLGAGAAGLSAALALEGARVLVVAPDVGRPAGATALAQGGIAAALGADDDWRHHLADTLAAGAGLVDVAAAASLASEGAGVIDRLLALGVDFDRDANGSLALGLEAAHSRRRIVHARDETGRAVAQALASAAARARHIRLRAGRAEAFGVDEDGVAGALVLDEQGRRSFVGARAVVLASGGVGALWSSTTNPPEALGAGLAYAAEQGAALADVEFVQFHPTALDVPARPLPLLSEALRGAGARLCDEAGRPVLEGKHPLGDLAPRDVVARELFFRQQAGQRTYLDARAILKVKGEGAFPSLCAASRAFGFDPARDLLPVTPAVHYHMGGVATDLDGRTSLPGLFACGEVACTGVHGANRLASNSLLEAVSFGAHVAHATPRHAREKLATAALLPARVLSRGVRSLDERAARDLTLVMGSYVGVVRSGAGLAYAAQRLDELARAPVLSGEVRARALAAFCVAAAALLRGESRGGHFREDFPAPSPLHRARRETTLAALRATALDERPSPYAARSSSLESTPSRLASR